MAYLLKEAPFTDARAGTQLMLVSQTETQKTVGMASTRLCVQLADARFEW